MCKGGVNHVHVSLNEEVVALVPVSPSEGKDRPVSMMKAWLLHLSVPMEYVWPQHLSILLRKPWPLLVSPNEEGVALVSVSSRERGMASILIHPNEEVTISELVYLNEKDMANVPVSFSEGMAFAVVGPNKGGVASMLVPV